MDDSHAARHAGGVLGRRPRPSAPNDAVAANGRGPAIWDRAVEDWDSPQGRALLVAVRERCPRWASRIDRQFDLARGTTKPDDVLSAAWLVLNRFGGQVARAGDPWGYLWTSVSHLCQAETADAITLIRPPRPSSACDRPRALRVGLQSPEFDAPRHHHGPPPRRTPLVRCVVRLLVEAGGDEEFWNEAVTRAVDVMADARRSYEVCAVRADPVLRKELCLDPNELSALAALLIGSRRGGTSQSLLAALCRDRRARLDGVARARERVATLLARPHVLAAAEQTAATSGAVWATRNTPLNGETVERNLGDRGPDRRGGQRCPDAG
jgi:hypothetical protein